MDLIAAWGLLASHAACCYGALPKPVIAPVIIDNHQQGVSYQSGVSGLENFSDKWLVLPWELDGLTREEIYRNKPFLAPIFEKLGAEGQAEQWYSEDADSGPAKFEKRDSRRSYR